jgi:choline monooxygenase
MALLPPFERDLALASTLPKHLYTSPDVFAIERERIFARTWQPVGPAEQARQTGDFFTAEVAGEPIVVVRDSAGKLRAFFNVCRHRAGAVAEGCGNRKALQCAYHGWTYALDGALLATPEFDGVQRFDRGAFGLVPLAVAEWGPLVFVNLDLHAPLLESFLAGIAERVAPTLHALRRIERRDYLVRANWKTYIDNYLEGYHIPLAHPALYRELDYANYRVETFRFCSLQHAPMREVKGQGERHYRPADGPALYAWVFPNWMLNRYPDHLQLNIVEPLAADLTRTVFEWYAPAPDGPEARATIARAIQMGEQTQREDVALCEPVQARLASRACSPGRFSVRRENGVHHFQGLVHEFLTSADTPGTGTMTLIYHLVAPADWRKGPADDYRAASLDTEGFIHCSYAAQVAGSANRFYASAGELLVLTIDPARLGAPLKVEPAGTGELFPHIYGPLNRSAVVSAQPLQREPDGRWAFST